MFAYEECEFFSTKNKLVDENNISICEEDEISLEDIYVCKFMSFDDTSDEKNKFLKEEKEIEFFLENNTYTDTFQCDLSAYEYNKIDILKFAFKNKLAITSEEELQNYRIGHYTGYTAISMLMKKIIKQIPAPSKNYSSQALVIISNLKNRRYDGKDIDVIVRSEGKKTVGEMIKLKEDITYNYTNYLHSNKKNTLPNYKDIISDEITELDPFYIDILNKHREILISRKDFEKVFKENIQNYDQINLDLIIQEWIRMS